MNVVPQTKQKCGEVGVLLSVPSPLPRAAPAALTCSHGLCARVACTLVVETRPRNGTAAAEVPARLWRRAATVCYLVVAKIPTDLRWRSAEGFLRRGRLCCCFRRSFALCWPQEETPLLASLLTVWRSLPPSDCGWRPRALRVRRPREWPQGCIFASLRFTSTTAPRRASECPRREACRNRMIE